MTVAVVIIHPVEGNGARTVEAGERFALLVELTLCQTQREEHVIGVVTTQSVKEENTFSARKGALDYKEH